MKIKLEDQWQDAIRKSKELQSYSPKKLAESKLMFNAGAAAILFELRILRQQQDLTVEAIIDLHIDLAKEIFFDDVEQAKKAGLI